jgi:hypothetical protein
MQETSAKKKKMQKNVRVRSGFRLGFQIQERLSASLFGVKIAASKIQSL